MPTTIGEMKEQMARALKQARAICDLATEANREFTQKERGDLDRYTQEAAGLKEKIQQAESDADLRNQILGLSALVDGGAGNRAPGPWAKAFHATGRKDLLPAGSTVVPGFSGIIAPAEGPLQTMLQVIPIEGATGDGISFLQETVRSHNAQAVADGELKPTSVYTLTQVTDRVRVVAHLSQPVPRRFFDDSPQLNRYLDGALREGLQQELERLSIEGAGSGEEFAGMLNTAGIQVATWSSDIISTTRKAITLLELINRPASAWVMNPEDWETIELIMDGEQRYYMGQQLPVDRAQRRLWGVPVALSTGIDQGTGVLFNRESLLLYERGPVRLDWSEAFTATDESQQEIGTGFETNQVRFRCEGRYLLAVLSPLGVVEVPLESGS